MQTIVINNTTRKLTPLLMKPELVSQTLKGVKTQTRRLNGLEEINQNPDKWNYDHQIIHGFVFETKSQSIEYDMIVIKSPYGQKGDIIWVRETWDKSYSVNSLGIQKFSHFVYKADNDPLHEFFKWKPNIHMPKQACRLFLEIVDVRPERLIDITEEDAINEGVKVSKTGNFYLNYLDEIAGITQFIYNEETAKKSFRSLWISLDKSTTKIGYDQSCWYRNPWVWRIEYKVIDKPDGWK